MRTRPVYFKELGLFLQTLRGARGWTQSAAARNAAKRSLPITRDILIRLEAGTVQHPRPEVLRAVAELYGLDAEALIGRYVELRYGSTIDPTRHDDKVQGGSPDPGGPLVAAQTRIRELEGRVAVYEALLAKLRTAAGEFIKLIPSGEEGGTATHRKQRRSKRD